MKFTMNSNAGCDEDDAFYFESDHLALRGNVDYSEVLKTMFVLEAQRKCALQDYNKVIEIKKECLKDPLTYIDKSQSGTLGIPPLQSIAEIPTINWSKYNSNVPEQFMREINSTRMDHTAKPIQHGKSTSAWTPEEQRKLEELLVKYPPEDVDRRRIIKIATELGTRTKEQVASRLQKYFLKLISAGLPVPGRLPKAASKYLDRKNKMQKKPNPGHYHRKYVKPSTFFPDSIIPVTMDDLHAPGPSTSTSTIKVEPVANNELVQSNYLIANNYHVDDKKPQKRKADLDIEVDLLKWVKNEKLIETNCQPYQHYGYKCDYCGEEPVRGSRWHCSICVNDSIDYCTDCFLSQFYSNASHDLHHKFLVIRNDKEVTCGPWSDSESDEESDCTSGAIEYSDNDEDMSEKSECEQNNYPSTSSPQDIDNISEQCPLDIFDPVYTNGNSSS